MVLDLMYVEVFPNQMLVGLVKMISLVCIDNRTKDILIFSKGPTNALDNTMMTGKKEYSINFTEQH